MHTVKFQQRLNARFSPINYPTMVTIATFWHLTCFGICNFSGK